ncbi:DNA gyrase inhibitor YacG [Pseudophaeobacter flagellatus]|uniref:DNA gyrase inhibitor YacG n=1 Tax=Pseudophaeobacter flagellatus TaxID=2899119 RepID=UPI001E3F12C1|nr:DNA gyrase inhibitor YacG [Pseudophaeobacter flagellatus]MCD9147943.1 DNA gyrase inhibitor YacG [Pseudophaeobacter flagellatus]
MNCPICSAPTAPSHRPFCSKRCADQDLLKWLNGSYAIPSNDPEDIEKAIEEPIGAEATSDSSAPIRH